MKELVYFKFCPKQTTQYWLGMDKQMTTQQVNSEDNRCTERKTATAETSRSLSFRHPSWKICVCTTQYWLGMDKQMITNFVDNRCTERKKATAETSRSLSFRRPSWKICRSGHPIYGALLISAHPQLRSCVTVEVAVLGFPSLISLMVSVDVKHG